MKKRKAESRRYEVRWAQDYLIYFRWFCRQGAARRLAESLKREGRDVILVDHAR